MYTLPPSQPGDIIFLSPNSAKSVSTAAQSIVRQMEARHGHVALAVKQGNAIHAMPKHGIRAQPIRALLLDSKYGEFKVFRNRNLDPNGEVLRRLEDNAWFHQAQKYNWRFFFPSRRDASFCSELAAKTYRLIGILVSPRSPSATLPIDIYRFISGEPDWEDVTEAYAEFFLTEKWDSTHDLASNAVQRIEEFNQHMGIGQRALVDKIDRIAKNSSQGPTDIRPSRDYWNNAPSRKTGMMTKICRRFFEGRSRKP